MGLFEEIKERFYGKEAPPQLRLAPKEKEYWKTVPLLSEEMLKKILAAEKHKDDIGDLVIVQRRMREIAVAFENLANKSKGASLTVNEDIQQSASYFKGAVEVLNARIAGKSVSNKLFLARLNQYKIHFEKKAKVLAA